MNEHYYCKNTRPVLRSSTTSSLSELMLDRVDDQCERKYFKLQHNFILPLSSGNTWFIIPSTRLDLVIHCKNDTAPLTIHETSLISIAHHCRLGNNEFLLSPIKTEPHSRLLITQFTFNFQKLKNFILRIRM